MEDAPHHGTVWYRINQAWSQVPCIHGKRSTNKANSEGKGLAKDNLQRLPDCNKIRSVNERCRRPTSQTSTKANTSPPRRMTNDE